MPVFQALAFRFTKKPWMSTTISSVLLTMVFSSRKMTLRSVFLWRFSHSWRPVFRPSSPYRCSFTCQLQGAKESGKSESTVSSLTMTGAQEIKVDGQMSVADL